MIRRQCFAKIGGYDPHFRTAGLEGCEDWNLYLRIAQYYQFTAVPEFLLSQGTE
jgi:predicted glycosyltransferase involved in capsule biosynthesis